jgi:hypothetical protein
MLDRRTAAGYLPRRWGIRRVQANLGRQRGADAPRFAGSLVPIERDAGRPQQIPTSFFIRCMEVSPGRESKSMKTATTVEEFALAGDLGVGVAPVASTVESTRNPADRKPADIEAFPSTLAPRNASMVNANTGASDSVKDHLSGEGLGVERPGFFGEPQRRERSSGSKRPG